MSNEFSGFPEATFKFLSKLKANNNRDWFKQNKPLYETDVLVPSLQFIEAVAPHLEKVSPHFLAVAKRMGGSLMRIYRDTRFSKDKTPYKTNIGIQFRHEFGKDIHAPGFYLHIAPAEIFFGAGIWHPESAALKKIRTHIVEEESEWKRLNSIRSFRSTFQFGGERLKRHPRDFDPEHPLIEDLKRKDFIVLATLDNEDLSSSGAVKCVVNLAKKAMPLMTFLCDSLKIPS